LNGFLLIPVDSGQNQWRNEKYWVLGLACFMPGGLAVAYPVLSMFVFLFILIIAQVHVLLSFSIAVSLFIERILTSEHTHLQNVNLPFSFPKSCPLPCHFFFSYLFRIGWATLLSTVFYLNPVNTEQFSNLTWIWRQFFFFFCVPVFLPAVVYLDIVQLSVCIHLTQTRDDWAVKQSIWQIPWQINHFCTVYVIRSDPWDNFFLTVCLPIVRGGWQNENS